MTFVDHDEIEKVWWDIRRNRACRFRPTHESLKDREEDAAVFGHPALLSDLTRASMRTSASSGKAEKAL